MIAVQQSLSLLRGQLLANGAFDPSEASSEVLAVAPNKIERIESRFATAKQQARELRIAAFIQAHDLSIQHGTVSAAFQRKGDAQRLEGLKLISISRYQPAPAIFNVG